MENCRVWGVNGGGGCIRFWNFYSKKGKLPQ